MSVEDPFFVVKSDVQKSLQNARSLYSRWCELLEDSSTASREEYEWTVTELKNSLRSIDWDLEDLAETISIVEKNPSKFKITNEELKERQTFIERMKATVLEMKNYVNSPEVKAKEEQKAKQNSAASRTLQTSGKYSGLVQNIEMNNQRIVDNTQKQQKMIIGKQDEQLTKIGSSVTVLKNMSQNIGNEMDEQNKLLDEFSGEMEHTESRIDSVMKKMAKVTHMSNDKRQWCAIICLLVIMAIVIALFFIF